MEQTASIERFKSLYTEERASIICQNRPDKSLFVNVPLAVLGESVLNA